MLAIVKKYLILIKNKLIYLNNYFIKKNLTYNFKMIFLSRITVNSATQLMSLFLPIFLYEFLGMNLQLVLLFYLINDFLFFNTISLGCRYIMNRIGINQSLQVSIFLGGFYYLFFFFLSQYVFTDHISWLLPVIIISLLFRLSHWIPYHVCIAKLTDQNIRSSQVSLMEAAILTLGAILPFIAGLILTYFGYSYLFLTAISIYLLALIFFKKLPIVEERFSWSYKKTWRIFFSKKIRSNVLAYFGEGAENVAKIVVWPIFIWQILAGNYLQVGIITSIIVTTTILLQILIGNLMDRFPNRQVWLRYSSIFHSLAWLLKALIVNPFQIFIFSTYYNISRMFAFTSLNILHYDIASEQGHYVDEYTVIREKAVVLGRIVMGLLSIIALFFLPIYFIFILAAIFSLFFTWLKRGEIFND